MDNYNSDIHGNSTETQESRQDVQYYCGGNFGSDVQSAAGQPPVQSRKLPTWAKALIIIGIIILCVVLLTTGCNKIIDSVTSGFTSDTSHDVVTDFGHDYIGTIYIEGEISEEYLGEYDHEYLINSIDAMIGDTENKGMILYVNTPGGSVFASDELYLKIREYQETTGRPVYSAMQSQATSGGYYVSAPADRIFANRNCWTGSIGVTMGTFIDVSGLLEKMGIVTETISSGENKSMGSGFEPITDEQRAILQGLIDEAYDQFVAIVAEGRSMDDAEVREIADGRIYTAAQALEKGLIDRIGTYEEAVADMKVQYGLEDCTVEEFRAEYYSDFFSLLGEAAAGGSVPDAELIQQLLELDGKVQLSYICEVRK